MKQNKTMFSYVDLISVMKRPGQDQDALLQLISQMRLKVTNLTVLHKYDMALQLLRQILIKIVRTVSGK